MHTPKPIVDPRESSKAKPKPKMMLVEKPVYEELALSAIVVDPELQSRVAMDMDHVRMLGRRRMDGLPTEPIIVFKDESDPKRVRYWLADGFHRHMDAKKARLSSIMAEIKPGTRRDALIYSAGANQKFSLPRKPEDIKKAVFMLLADEEWWGRGDTVIGKHCGVSQATARKYRLEFSKQNNKEIPTHIVTASGSVRTISVARGKERRSIKKDKGTLYVFHNYKRHFLGSDPVEAEKKAAEILDGVRRRNISVSDYRHIKSFLVSEHVHSDDSGFKPSLGVSGYRGEGWAASFTAFLAADDAVKAIGRALLIRQHHCPSGRAVVICHPEDGPAEILDLARRLGVEFMTPDEFVASVKGSEEAGAAVLA